MDHLSGIVEVTEDWHSIVKSKLTLIIFASLLCVFRQFGIAYTIVLQGVTEHTALAKKFDTVDPPWCYSEETLFLLKKLERQ